MDPPLPAADHEAFRAEVRAHLDEVVVPHAERWEELGHVPREAWRALGRRGLLAVGHEGDAMLRSAVLLEELGATGYAGLRAAIGVHAYMAASYLTMLGTPAQRASHLDPARRGERVSALAITDAGAGSDLRRIDTVAEPDGGGWRVTGCKRYVANGMIADQLITLVRTGGGGARSGLAGANLLIIDGSAPGLRRTPVPLLGWHSAGVAHVELDGVAVPAGGLLGRPGRALLHLMAALDVERLVAGLLAVGGARHGLELLGRFVRDHRVRDAPLSANQAVRHRVADLAADLAVVRHFAYGAAAHQGRGRLDTATASIVKLKATELATAVAQACTQLQGAAGYEAGAVAARLLRDSAAGTIAGGASELLRDLIFESAPAGGGGRNRS